MRPALSIKNRFLSVKNTDGEIITLSYRNDFGRVYYWLKKEKSERGTEISQNELYDILNQCIER